MNHVKDVNIVTLLVIYMLLESSNHIQYKEKGKKAIHSNIKGECNEIRYIKYNSTETVKLLPECLMSIFIFYLMINDVSQKIHSTIET